MTEFKKFKELEYIMQYPEGYRSGDRCPVIMLLHGAGYRGEDINFLTNNAYFKETAKHEGFPFITIAPQCHTNTTWFDWFGELKELANYIANADFADRRHIYLMGPSMGGYGTWQLGMSCPEIFAAIVPICGGGMYWNTARLKNTPVWAFHGALDTTVLPEESKKMVDRVNHYGGEAILTIYPDNAHNAWSDTYGNYDVFKWLLSKENSYTVEEDAGSHSGDNFG